MTIDMKLLTAKDLTQILSCKLSTVYTLPINRYKLGGMIRYDEADVISYIQSCKIASVPLPSIELHGSCASKNDIDKIIDTARQSVLGKGQRPASNSGERRR